MVPSSLKLYKRGFGLFSIQWALPWAEPSTPLRLSSVHTSCRDVERDVEESGSIKQCNANMHQADIQTQLCMWSCLLICSTFPTHPMPFTSHASLQSLHCIVMYKHLSVGHPVEVQYMNVNYSPSVFLGPQWM